MCRRRCRGRHCRLDRRRRLCRAHRRRVAKRPSRLGRSRHVACCRRCRRRRRRCRRLGLRKVRRRAHARHRCRTRPPCPLQMLHNRRRGRNLPVAVIHKTAKGCISNPVVALACTCTPYLRLREKLPRSGDRIDEHADQTGTLEKSRSAPIALVWSVGWLLVRDTLRSAGAASVVVVPDQDVLAPASTELPLLSAAYPRIDTVSRANCQPGDGCANVAWIVQSDEDGGRPVIPPGDVVASRLRLCRLTTQSDQLAVLHVALAVPGEQPVPEIVTFVTWGKAGGSMEMPSC